MTDRRHVLPIAVLALLAGLPTSALTDELHLKNGSLLIGTVVSATETKIVFDTDFAGRISVDMDDVDTFFTQDPVTILMQDGAIMREQRVASRDRQLIAVDDTRESALFDVEEIKLINPEPWQLGEGYNWFGRFEVAGEYERGNSDSDEIDTSIDTTWRSLVDRYRIRGEQELDRSNNVKTKDQWTLRTQYDRFFKQDVDNYWGGRAMFEYDRFADLDLRTTIGPHIGRQFYEKPILDLKGEIGVAWVDEQFDEADDSDHFAGTWAFNVESDILGFGTTLYALHDGTVDVTDTDKLIANTIIGIRMPVYWGFETAFEAKYEYDGGASDDVDDLDETYNVKIGYKW